MMADEIPDLNAQREARDIEFERTFIRAHEIAEELRTFVDQSSTSAPGTAVTVPLEVLTRAALMLSFCAGYGAGAAPTEAIRAAFRRMV